MDKVTFTAEGWPLDRLGRVVRRKYALNEAYFDHVSTQEQAYWLGFLVADGGIVRSGTKTYSLRVELAEHDRTHVRAFLDALGCNKPVRIRQSGASSYKASTFVGVSIDSRYLVEALGRLGVTPRKSATAKPWDGPPHLMPHYWRGLFDGDGSIGYVRSTGSWTLSICGSEACVRAFATWASAVCGSRAKPRHSPKTETCWYWTLCGTPIVKLLAEALYAGATVALPRKRERAGKILALDLGARRVAQNQKKSARMKEAWARAPVREQGGHRKQAAS